MYIILYYIDYTTYKSFRKFVQLLFNFSLNWANLNVNIL